MRMGLASSPVWFVSIMLRVCEGLEKVQYFIDDMVSFRRTDVNTSATDIIFPTDSPHSTCN